MRLLWILFSAVVFAFAAGDASAQQTGLRLALVIGNANYPDADTPLKEPVQDARALAEELRRSDMGFDVDVAENLSKEATRKAFDRFFGKIKPGSVAMVFFSGYAIQSARQSYIIPVDAQIWTESDVRRDGISLDTVLKEMNSRGARVKIVILDASRRNPFERRFRPASSGLGPVDAPTGSLVMYSSAPSTVVDDSSVFVNELVGQLRETQLPADEVFNRTRVGVSKGSQEKQVPWLSSSLAPGFFFSLNPGAKVATASSPPAASGAPAAAAPASAPTPPPVVAAPPPAAPPAPPPVAVAPAATAPPGPVAALPAAPPTGGHATLAPAPAAPPAAAVPTPIQIPPEDMAAIQDLNRKLGANPNDADSFYRRGQIYAKNDDFTRAAVDFDAAIKLKPKDAEALNNRCWVRAILGDLQAALQDCDASLQIKPDYVDTLDSRGFVKLKLGQAQNAIADYDAALKISAKKASSLYGRGLAKLRAGNATGNNDIAAAKAIDPGVADEFDRYGVR